MSTPQPFKINIAQAKLDAIRSRIEAYQWFPAARGLARLAVRHVDAGSERDPILLAQQI